MWGFCLSFILHCLVCCFLGGGQKGRRSGHCELKINQDNGQRSYLSTFPGIGSLLFHRYSQYVKPVRFVVF